MIEYYKWNTKNLNSLNNSSYPNMNNIYSYNPSLILSQQFIIQNMMIYQQLLKAQLILIDKSQQQQRQKIEETEQSNSLLIKEDTNPVNLLPQTNLKKKEQKLINKMCSSETDTPKMNSTPNKKKKVFLSMLDIKQAQYKKFKVISVSEHDKLVPVKQEEQI